MKKLFLFIGSLFLSANFLAVAQMNIPQPPQNLRAVVIPETAPLHNQVKLIWNVNPNGPRPELFNIYEVTQRAGVVSSAKIGFIKVEPNKNISEYSYKIEREFSPGVYYFYVTAGKIVGNTIVESQPSNTVTVQIDRVGIPFYLRIVSKPPTFARVGKLYHYEVRFETNVNCPMTFALENAPQGMRISQQGVVEWVPQEVGTYPVRIRIAPICDINVQPAIQEYSLVVKNEGNDHSTKPFIRIVSIPPSVGFVGQEWIYPLKVEQNVDCPFEVFVKIYSRNFQQVENAYFDQNDKAIHWIPIQTGSYNGYVMVRLTCDTLVYTYQQFVVVVSEFGHRDNCAQIYGTVSFDDNTPVPNGIVYAWRVLNDSIVPLQGLKPISTTINNGSFSLYLESGLYILEFDGSTFEHIFFDNAKQISDATILDLTCDKNNPKVIQIEVRVNKKPLPKHYKVSGLVTSADDNSPVLAVIEFIPVELMQNDRAGVKYPELFHFVAKTDQNGYYQIELPDIFTYKAHCIPMDKQTYQEQYFDGVNSPFEADIIELTGDVDGIDFRLVKHHFENTNGFSGNVVDDDSLRPLKAYVIAYMVVPDQKSNVRYYSQMVQTDEQGYYQFQGLPYGQYVLFSVPLNRDYVPGYYKMGDFATLKWRDATRIYVGEVMPEIVYTVKHRLRFGLRGLVSVEGQVIESTGLVKIANLPQESGFAGLAEAFVYALDEFGEVSDFFVTDNNGYFTLASLPERPVEIYATKPGYEEYSTQVAGNYKTASYFNLIVPIARTILDVSESASSDIYVLQNTGSIVLKVGNEEKILSCEITDIFGNFVLSDNSNGLSEYEFSTVTFSSGVYLVRIKTERSIKFVKIVIFN